MKTPDNAQALVIIDMQSAFLDGVQAVPAASRLIDTVEHLLVTARSARALVVHIQHDGGAGAPDEVGTAGWLLHLTVEQGTNECVIRKTSDDAFADTNLAELLVDRGVRRLVICGLLSEMCVSATARTALALGFEVLLPRDAHATSDIPEAPEVGPAVPASVVSRVAEWALGDKVNLVAAARFISFTAPVHG
jgi:streptothricin hydrolase